LYDTSPTLPCLLKRRLPEADSEDVRRPLVFLLCAFVLGGCQGSSDSGYYDQQAKDEALRAAKKDPFDGYSDRVSVGSVHERGECRQAPSPKPGPCLSVAVTSDLPARDLSGKKVGLNVQTEWDVFIWLEKRGDGRWKVTHTSYRPKGAAVNG
jgi:hypothetical protein